MTPQVTAQDLAPAFANDAEWQAHYIRIKRIIRKRDAGKDLTGGEKVALADYKVILSLAKPPHTRGGDIIPPVLRGYNEAADAFGVTRGQLYGLRANKCPAFIGNDIYAATLHAALLKDPNPKPAALNAVHTGRKGKWTKDLEDSIVAALKGCPMFSIVAAAHGLDESTLSKWKTKGAKGEKKYAEFFTRTAAAIAEAKTGLLTDIASNTDWRAKAKVLELTDPKNFGGGNGGARIDIGGAGATAKGDGPPAPIIITLNGVTENPYAGIDEDAEAEDKE